MSVPNRYEVTRGAPPSSTLGGNLPVRRLHWAAGLGGNADCGSGRHMATSSIQCRGGAYDAGIQEIRSGCCPCNVIASGVDGPAVQTRQLQYCQDQGRRWRREQGKLRFFKMLRYMYSTNGRRLSDLQDVFKTLCKPRLYLAAEIFFVEDRHIGTAQRRVPNRVSSHRYRVAELAHGKSVSFQ